MHLPNPISFTDVKNDQGVGKLKLSIPGDNIVVG